MLQPRAHGREVVGHAAFQAAGSRAWRALTLDLQPDLFGEWCSVREWGRIGRPGQMRSGPYPTEDEAKEALARQRCAKERRGYRSA